MIGRLIELCARNRMLVLLATWILVGVGVWSVANTPLDALPDLSDTQVIVYTEYPGQAPQVVEDQVTSPSRRRFLPSPTQKSFAASRTSGCPSSTLFSRTGRTSTGPARACLNT